MQDSPSNDSFVGEENDSAHQRLLWDMFLLFGVFTTVCCLTLHRAGLNDWNDPVSVEYAEGNPLAAVFLFASVGLTIVTGLLYRCFGRTIEALILFGVFISLTIMIASKPHTTIHFYSFYATVGGSIVTPLFALYRLRIWSHFFAIVTPVLFALLLLNCLSAIDLGRANIGFAQRTWFILAWLSNFSVLAQYKFAGRIRSL